MNINKLRSKMVEAGFSQASLAKAVGMNEHTLCNRFTLKTDFDVSEVRKICETLKINDSKEIVDIFFA